MMDFYDFSASLRQEIEKELPGESGQMLMSPLGRVGHKKAMQLYPNPTPSAILIALYPKNNETHTLLMVRNSYDGHHSGQVSFPGGKVEDQDENLMQTALREFEEEMGVDSSGADVLGKLSPLLVPPSGFIIHPYVAAFAEELNPVPEKSEVAEVIEASFSTIFNSQTKQEMSVSGSSPKFKMKAPAYVLNGHVVWGATAMIMSELEVICKRFHF